MPARKKPIPLSSSTLICSTPADNATGRLIHSIRLVNGVSIGARGSNRNPTARNPGQSINTCNPPLRTTVTASHTVAFACPASVDKSNNHAPATIATMRQRFNSTLAAAGPANFS